MSDSALSKLNFVFLFMWTASPPPEPQLMLAEVIHLEEDALRCPFISHVFSPDVPRIVKHWVCMRCKAMVSCKNHNDSFNQGKNSQNQKYIDKR